MCVVYPCRPTMFRQTAKRLHEFVLHWSFTVPVSTMFGITAGTFASTMTFVALTNDGGSLLKCPACKML